MPPTGTKDHPMDVSACTVKEVEMVVGRARSASAPGPSSVPCRLYKNAPDVLWLFVEVYKGSMEAAAYSFILKKVR